MANGHDLVRAERARVEREVAAHPLAIHHPGSRRVAMAYPSPYRAGMSSLGFQHVLGRLRAEGLSAERVFLPDDPAAWKATRQSPVSLETGTPLRDFAVIGFSLAYEIELAGLIELLELSGIPPLREDRGPEHPVILLGGPISMANPLPAAPFVDAMLLGEAEDTAAAGFAAWFDADTRDGWLDAIADLPGGFVPERHGTIVPPIAKASDTHLPARSLYLCPDAELSSMFLIEGERGCHRQCTFCVMRRSTNGGMRLVGPEAVLGHIPDHARKVGLVGAAISDHPKLVDLLDTLVKRGKQVSVSSLRADRVMVRPRIAELLRESGAQTLTVASDGPSERMRKFIKKGTTEAHLDGCAEQAARLRFRVFKVYMMIGIPGETDDDIDELIQYTLALAKRAGPARVALGVAPFVAKRHTPLDGEPFAGIDVVEHRMHRLLRGLRGRADVRPASARWAWVEYAIAQGGPETGLAVYEAWKKGGKFAHYRAALGAVNPESLRPWRSEAGVSL